MSQRLEPQRADAQRPDPVDPRVLRATEDLLASFTPCTGRWNMPTGEAWQPALAIEAVLMAYELTHDVCYLDIVDASFARYRGRRSRFYDDDGWYLNAWLRAYDVTGDRRYLAEAAELFEVMTGAWDSSCGGGVWWSTERSYKNAITNELFLLAAARLARRTTNPSYVDWAVRTWRWFSSCGMINADGLVNDGLNENCVNNGQPTWTYNQGVILGGLAELSLATGERSYLADAGAIAAAATRRQVHESLHNGHPVLREAGDPQTDNRDAHAFKGIFTQGLARLHAVDPASTAGLATFLRANADAVWHCGQTSGFAMCWQGPPGPVNGATQASAALLLGAVALIEHGGETPARPSVDERPRAKGGNPGTPLRVGLAVRRWLRRARCAVLTR